MKKILAALTITCILLSCNDSKNSSENASSSDTGTNSTMQGTPGNSDSGQNNLTDTIQSPPQTNAPTNPIGNTTSGDSLVPQKNKMDTPGRSKATHKDTAKQKQ